MVQYLIRPRERLFVKGYGFLSFAKNMGKNICENISKNLSGKYSQKRLAHTKQLATNAPRTVLKIAFQKTAEATSDLNGNKIAEVITKLYDGKITKVSRTSPQNSLKTVKNEHDKEIPKERYIYISKRKAGNY